MKPGDAKAHVPPGLWIEAETKTKLQLQSDWCDQFCKIDFVVFIESILVSNPFDFIKYKKK